MRKFDRFMLVFIFVWAIAASIAFALNFVAAR